MGVMNYCRVLFIHELCLKKDKNEGVTVINHIGGTKCIDTRVLLSLSAYYYMIINLYNFMSCGVIRIWRHRAKNDK